MEFGPTRVVIPGTPGNEFGGGTYDPGSKGDTAYSPLITTGNGIVLNATQVANKPVCMTQWWASTTPSSLSR